MSELGLDYSTTWGRRYSARFVRHVIQHFLFRPYLQWAAHLEVRGLENLEGSRPVIFTANHASHLDTALVLSALPAKIRNRTVVAAAMDNFFMDRRTARRTVLMFNAIPVDRHKVNRRSAQIALDLVQDHWNLLIYPEGGRTPDGMLHEFKGGAAYLAERAGASVIPTYVHESGFLQGPKWAKAPMYVDVPSRRRHRVIVAFDKPLRSDEGESIRHFNARIETAVEQLGREVSGNPDYGIVRDSN
ncbi:MAG: 1-acyl-sn-glycerol-3-phosphate acyltransferase [Acidobacteriota bacterium]|nr:1-acyl-sn-glycerol-3-phosphate acyltransferase [Acidobacteriota bacterium]